MPDDGRRGGQRSFYETITAAVNDMIEHGYDSEERVARWMREIRAAAERDMVPDRVVEEQLRATLSRVWVDQVERGGLLKRSPGVSSFDLTRVKPKLRAELDRRIMASASLIRLNRAKAMETTLQRFAGWSTSIPVGGTDAADRRDEKARLRKSLAALPFEERRVAIDQGHKFNAALSEILANDSGAIAARWHSHWRQANYDYRKDHKERDGRVYAVRGNWAIERGLMKPGPDGYTDEITRPAEEVFCRCTYTYLFALRRLPDTMITERGRSELEKLRSAA